MADSAVIPPPPPLPKSFIQSASERAATDHLESHSSHAHRLATNHPVDSADAALQESAFRSAAPSSLKRDDGAQEKAATDRAIGGESSPVPVRHAMSRSTHYGSEYDEEDAEEEEYSEDEEDEEEEEEEEEVEEEEEEIRPSSKHSRSTAPTVAATSAAAATASRRSHNDDHHASSTHHTQNLHAASSSAPSHVENAGSSTNASNPSNQPPANANVAAHSAKKQSWSPFPKKTHTASELDKRIAHRQQLVDQERLAADQARGRKAQSKATMKDKQKPIPSRVSAMFKRMRNWGAEKRHNNSLKSEEKKLHQAQAKRNQIGDASAPASKHH